MENQNFFSLLKIEELTERAIRGKSEPAIEQRIKEHKEEIRRFFLALFRKANFHSELVGKTLFLIYPGATTESANMKSMKPISAGRQAASSLFDLYST